MPAAPSAGAATGTASREAAWEAARMWARSGVAGLCGDPGGPPLLPPLPAAHRIAGIADAIREITSERGRPVRVRWEAALGGRAAVLGLARRGRTSANGSCRLIRAADIDLALNLPRDDDISLIPALTSDAGAERRPWDAASATAAGMPAADFVERARLLGMAASAVGERSHGDLSTLAPYTSTPRGVRAPRAAGQRFRVVDLSALWAGPVAARVLCEAGGEVIRVESVQRPDAARERPEFHSWVHPANETTERVDFSSIPGRRRLREILESADVVIESSRPRALEQIGVGPDQVQPPEGQVWLSITGHGRTGPEREWTAFGDDAAAGGGLVCRDPSGSFTFCGDAIADPVAGLAGAMAVLRCLAEGGGRLVDVSLSGVAAWAAAGGVADQEQLGFRVEACRDGWVLRDGRLSEPVAVAPPTIEWIASGPDRLHY